MFPGWRTQKLANIKIEIRLYTYFGNDTGLTFQDYFLQINANGFKGI